MSGGFRLFSCIAMLLSITACTTTRVVKPIEKNELQIGLDVGGPFVNKQLLPLSSLHMAYGVHENLSFFSGIHGTTLAFQTVQVDFGWCYQFREQEGIVPGMSVNTVFNPMMSLRSGSFRLYPELTPNFYWDLNDKHLFHLGMTNWLDFTAGKVEIGEGAFWHPGAQLGYRYEMKRWVLAAEYKLLNFNKQLQIPQATVNTPVGRGGHGIYFTLNYRIHSRKIENND